MSDDKKCGCPFCGEQAMRATGTMMEQFRCGTRRHIGDSHYTTGLACDKNSFRNALIKSDDEVTDLKTRIVSLEKALRAIISHQEISGGTMSKYSTVSLIANEALNGKADDGDHSTDTSEEDDMPQPMVVPNPKMIGKKAGE